MMTTMHHTHTGPNLSERGPDKRDDVLVHPPPPARNIARVRVRVSLSRECASVMIDTFP